VARSLERRQLGWGTISRPLAGRTSGLVSFASIGKEQSCRQANAITAVMEAFARMVKFGGAEAPEQFLFYAEWRLAVQ
jgi:hypothetical protein